MFLQVSVILLTGGTGVPHPPGSRHPPWSRHPPEQTPPEQTPPCQHAVRYGQHTGGTHPTGMQSCLLLLSLLGIDQGFITRRAM